MIIISRCDLLNAVPVNEHSVSSVVENTNYGPGFQKKNKCTNLHILYNTLRRMLIYRIQCSINYC